MTSPVTTVACLPNDTFYEIFNKLNLYELQSIGLVSKQLHRLINKDLFWTPYPDISFEGRFNPGRVGLISREEWEKDGFTCIETRIINFIQRNPVPGKVSHLEVTFDQWPGPKVSFWMGEGITPTLQHWVFDEPEDAATGDIVCAPADLIVERCIVMGSKVVQCTDFFSEARGRIFPCICDPHTHSRLHTDTFHYFSDGNVAAIPNPDRRYNNLMSFPGKALYNNRVSQDQIKSLEAEAGVPLSAMAEVVQQLPTRWFWMTRKDVNLDINFITPALSERSIYWAAKARIAELDKQDMRPYAQGMQEQDAMVTAVDMGCTIS